MTGSLGSAESHEAVSGIRDFELQVLWLVIGIKGIEIGQRDAHRAALRNCEVEVAADRGWNIADMGRQFTALFHRHAAVLDIAGCNACALDRNQLLDPDIALQCAANFCVVGFDLAEEFAAFLDDDFGSRNAAFDIAPDFDATTTLDVAFQHGSFADDQHTSIVGHRLTPVTHTILRAASAMILSAFRQPCPLCGRQSRLTVLHHCRAPRRKRP